MIAENQLKKVLLILLSVTLIVYILMTEVFLALSSSFSIASIENITYVIKLISFVASISIAFLTSRSSFIARKVLREKYIAGKYEGISRKIDRNNVVQDTHNENLIIIQNLLSVKISGESIDSNNESYARWDGFAVNINEDVDYYEFIVRMNTNKGSHTGIFEFTIRDGLLKGYHPGKSSKWSFDMKKGT